MPEENGSNHRLIFPELTRREFLEGMGKLLAATSLLSLVDVNSRGQSEELDSKTHLDDNLNFDPNLEEQINHLLDDVEESQRYRIDDLEESLDKCWEANQIYESNPCGVGKDLGRRVKNRTAQLYLERPFVYYINGKANLLDNPQVASCFKASKELGMESLELSDIFAENYNGKNYCKTIDELDKNNYNEEDLYSLLTYAHGSVGNKFYGENKRGLFGELNDIKKIISSYEKAKELDRDFFGANSLSTLGATNVIIEKYVGEKVPIGKEIVDFLLSRFLSSEISMERGEKLLEESIDESDDFLFNRVLYGGIYATNLDDDKGKEIYENELSEIFERSRENEIKEKWPIWNRVAITLASDLKWAGYEETKRYYRELIS